MDREDLVQASMIEFIRSIGRYRGECSLETWASTISAHVVYKHVRRRRVERRVFSSSNDQAVEAAAPTSVSRSVIARDLEGRIRKHLEEMEETKAWTFVLHDVCGFDLREIARITDVSVAAAQRRLVRGRREVHDRMASDPELANCLAEMRVES